MERTHPVTVTKCNIIAKLCGACYKKVTNQTRRHSETKTGSSLSEHNIPQ